MKLGLVQFTFCFARFSVNLICLDVIVSLVKLLMVMWQLGLFYYAMLLFLQLCTAGYMSDHVDVQCQCVMAIIEWLVVGCRLLVVMC